VEELLAAGIPALALQPSASLLSRRGALAEWHTATITRALDHDLVAVVHGDVAFDETQGSSIMSTEQLLERLVHTPALSPARIILVGETGVYTADPRADPRAERIPRIDATNIAAVLRGTSGSHGVDVTGGMRAKINLIWRLVEAAPGLAVQLIGPQPELLTRALLNDATGEGTIITA
jgi:isopentenyl phosphate kinase